MICKSKSSVSKKSAAKNSPNLLSFANVYYVLFIACIIILSTFGSNSFFNQSLVFILPY